MKNAELSSQGASRASLTSADADRIVNAVFNDLQAALANGDMGRVEEKRTCLSVRE
ncbi:MAG: hypothetical protein OXJ55_03125 [Caldilineaceae bacterium]|nr:hypothetical protein [Caldilineaceae bacterium]